MSKRDEEGKNAWLSPCSLLIINLNFVFCIVSSIWPAFSPKIIQDGEKIFIYKIYPQNTSRVKRLSTRHASCLISISEEHVTMRDIKWLLMTFVIQSFIDTWFNLTYSGRIRKIKIMYVHYSFANTLAFLK